MCKINNSLIPILIIHFKKIYYYFSVIVFLIPQTGTADSFNFIVAADMRNYSGSGVYDIPNYFRGACEAIDALGTSAFMVCPGDIDPTVNINWTIEEHIGPSYLWYPVVGNHELPGKGNEEYYGANMDWLRSYNYDQNGPGVSPDIVNTGPSGCEETTFSFDYENAHFVILNQYYDGSSDIGTDGDVTDPLYNWLAADLAATTKQHIFVFGHEPAYPQPDAYNGRLRHQYDSLNKYPQNRDRFWNLLKNEGVVAYICGHTHNYSAVNIEGVFQLDAGHARGAGDTGSPSTFLVIYVDGNVVTMSVYRDTHDGTYDYYDLLTDVSLPVELSSFTVRQDGDAVKLEWITESEINNLGFIIERREERTTLWREIASYITHNELVGKGSLPHRTIYELYDYSVQAGFTYEYRLADVSYDGDIKYHGIRKLGVRQYNDKKLSDEVNLMTTFPNPFISEIDISYFLSIDSDINMVIIDLMGRIVKHLVKNKRESSGRYSVKWDGTNDGGVKVASGVYLSIMIINNTMHTRKVLLVQ